MTLLGVIPISIFTVFLFLQSENLADWWVGDVGHSITSSVASIKILVFGYSYLKISGMCFFTMLHDGNCTIALKLRYIKFIHVKVMRDTDDCDIPNRWARSNSGIPKRSRTSVIKNCSSNGNLLGGPHLMPSNHLCNLCPSITSFLQQCPSRLPHKI